jgi:dUTP pyrophosphatase
MKIKVLEKKLGCMPQIIKKGDWIDLCASEDVELKCPQANRLHKYKEFDHKVRDIDFYSALIPLGVAMEIPKGYEAILVPRSSTFLKMGILQTNSIGVIDNTYSSDKDEWKMPALAIRNVKIPEGTRIAQFRVQLSQKATFWQKIKWLFSSGVKLEQVASLDNETRGGFGSTGE